MNTKTVGFLSTILMLWTIPAKADSIAFSFTLDPIGCSQQFGGCTIPISGSGVFDTITPFVPGIACTTNATWYGLVSGTGQINGAAMTLAYPWMPGCKQALGSNFGIPGDIGDLFFTINNQTWEIFKSANGPTCSDGGKCVYVFSPTVNYEPIQWTAQYITPEPETLYAFLFIATIGAIFLIRRYQR